MIIDYNHPLYEGKGKTIPVQSWKGPVVSRWLKLPDFKTFDTRRC